MRSRRVGGASYQVPTLVGPKRAQSLSIRWILAAIRDVKGKPTPEKLAAEFLDAYNKQGTAYTRRETVQRMADSNKAFSHFANFSR